MALPQTATLAEGDLIFSCIGGVDDPISAVTEGYRGARLNHVGVALRNQLGWYVLEAIRPEVRVTSWDLHIRRTAYPLGAGNSRYIVGRLEAPHRHLIPAALRYGLSVRDTPYDQLHLTDDDALYCSELVVDMFASANSDQQFFAETPMSFRDPMTGEILPAWQAYYDYFGIPVPNGEPGSNPGAMSRDSRLEIIAVVGPVPGYS